MRRIPPRQAVLTEASSALAVAFGIAFPQRQAQAWLVRVGGQDPARRVQGAVEEHPLDPLVVMEVLDVPQVRHRYAHPRMQVGRTVPGDLQVVRCRQPLAARNR